MLLLALAAAWAADHHVVRPGDTAASVAAAAGVDESALRARNELAAGAEPAVGSVLVVPGLDDDQGGLVLALSGVATATAPGGVAAPLREGQVLVPGSTVCTGVASYTTLRVASDLRRREHDEVSLLSQTCVRLDNSHNGASTRSSVLSVAKGSISVRNADTSSSTITVVTEDGVTTSEGGGFRLTVEGAATRTEALYRPLSVLGGGVDQRLDAGYGSRVEAGRAPSTPVRLLDPGTPIHPLGPAPLLRASFAWSPRDRALGYRVEIAASADFSDLVQVEDVPSATWDPEVLSLPYRVVGLWWRVASFDRTGYLGIPSAGAAIVVPPAIRP